MKDILSEIIAHKQTEIELQKQTVSPEQLQEQAGIIIRENAAHHRSMKQALAASSTGIISEFKRRSPSKGWINEAAQAEEIPASYEAAGAAALSILTDEKFFGGTLRDIRTARPLVRIPILRKDFIIDEYQLLQACIVGADAVLLIAACLSPEQCSTLTAQAHELGLEVLLEIHSPSELSYINKEVDMVGVYVDINSPKDQNPELWANYMQVLNTYKQSKHYIAYTRFDNSPEKPVNEGSYLRSLPDSLDIVALCNPGNISDNDREDILLLREKSTRVIYLVDYAAQAATFTDAAALGTWLDKAVTAATELNLDGFAFTGVRLYSGTDAEMAARKEAAQLIVSKLSAATGGGKLLVFEGNPGFIESADLEKLNYIVLNTADLTNVSELNLLIAGLPDSNVLPREKVLLSARIGDQIVDEKNEKQSVVPLMTDCVAAMGPLGGLAIHNIGSDYYSANMNYETTRTAIQQMNPSK